MVVRTRWLATFHRVAKELLELRSALTALRFFRCLRARRFSGFPARPQSVDADTSASAQGSGPGADHQGQKAKPNDAGQRRHGNGHRHLLGDRLGRSRIDNRFFETAQIRIDEARSGLPR